MKPFTARLVRFQPNGLYELDIVELQFWQSPPFLNSLTFSHKTAALLSGGCGFVIGSHLDEAQKAAAVEFVKYMTSPEIAARIIEKGIGMAPSTEVDYDALAAAVTTDDAKLLVEACRLCQNADYQVLPNLMK